MPQRAEHFSITATAGTAAPGTTVPLDFQDGIAVGIEVYIPSGHAGLTGLRMYYGQQQVVPKQGAGFLRGNDKTYHFELENYPTGTGWSAQVFNTGAYDHAFECGFEMDELVASDDVLPPVLLLPSVTRWG